MELIVSENLDVLVEQMEEYKQDQLRTILVTAIAYEDRQTMELHKDKFTKEFMEDVIANAESFGKMFVVRYHYTEPSPEISDGNDGTVYSTVGMKMEEKYMDIVELIKRVPYYQTPEYFQMFMSSEPNGADVFELTRTVYSFNTWFNTSYKKDVV